MLKLTASFGKKVPAEVEFSSKSYHAEIEVELPEGLSQEQLQERIHDTFNIVKESVESELQTINTAPQQPQQKLSYAGNKSQQQNTYSQNKNYVNKSQGSNNARQISAKQKNYLLNLLRESGIEISTVLQNENIGNLDELTSKRCSAIIDEIKVNQAA